MPPKRTIRVQPADPPRAKRAPRGYIGATYDAVMDPDNAAVVTSVALFGFAVAFLASPLSEVLGFGME